MVVRPHEGTLSEPKGDRLNLLWALQANTSPILTLFEDKEQKVSSLLATQEHGKPLLSTKSVLGERHAIWAITESDVIDQIHNNLIHQPLYIADGHHRYESALTYRREMRSCSLSLSGDEPFNFVMMTLVDFSDPGLVILPANRLVRGMPKLTLDGLMTRLKTFFETEELPINMPDIWRKVDALLGEEDNQVKLILVGPKKEHIFMLRLDDFAAAGQMMPQFHSELYKKLDVSIVDHVILEKLLGMSRDKEEACLAYSYDRADAVNKVREQDYQLAFILSPVRAEMIKAIADAGDRMPRKSTYFYPKLPSGLVLHRLV